MDEQRKQEIKVDERDGEGGELSIEELDGVTGGAASTRKDGAIISMDAP